MTFRHFNVADARIREFKMMQYPWIEGLQASAGSSRCSRKARPTVAFRRGACSNRRGCVNFNAQRPLREFQQTVGQPPIVGVVLLAVGWPRATWRALD